MVYAARNLAVTMPGSETGAVKSSCSVLSFRSSLKDFMVSTGRITENTKIIIMK